MFRSIKIYKEENIEIDELLNSFVDFGYKRQEKIGQEGDFSRRGAILDIYPVVFDCPLRIEFIYQQIASIKSYDLVSGRIIWEHEMVIILPKTKTSARYALSPTEEIPLHHFIDLKKGDFIVHTKYGIGRYLGREKVQKKDIYEEYIVIEYAKRDKLYVPIKDAHLVQKYISFEGKAPRLYRLGTKEWNKIKEKTRKGMVKTALELLETQAKRKALTGFKFSKDSDWQEQFENSFEFIETPDQAKAVKEVKQDMESTHPMERLICGDVGYGKTEVALRACFKAVMDNKQVCFLVPTTILAEQHYQNLSKRLEKFAIKVVMLNRFKSKSEQKEIVVNLAKGAVDIVIGTHRLLSQDINFKNLGLLIIDEEQKFGVNAKEKLKKIKLMVDVLTLTATPIPRTLYMSLMGAMDISVINTPPTNRVAVQTKVLPFRKEIIRDAIKYELSRKGQVFFVHNRVEDIQEVRDLVKSLSPNSARVDFAHGQMPPKLLEQIMLSFLNGKTDVLVSTNIVESGIDIPKANTIIINNADNFGLSDLHQLRGRVGRFNMQAYAYFLVEANKIINRDAKRRLEAIEKYSELGSGFKIAMEDLEIRGAGNLLGLEQHGYIMSIGFDLYCRLFRQIIAQLKEYKNN